MKPGNQQSLYYNKTVPKATWTVEEIPNDPVIVSTYSLWVNPFAPMAKVNVFEAMLLSVVAEHVWPAAATSNNTSIAIYLYIRKI